MKKLKVIKSPFCVGKETSGSNSANSSTQGLHVSAPTDSTTSVSDSASIISSSPDYPHFPLRGSNLTLISDTDSFLLDDTQANSRKPQPTVTTKSMLSSEFATLTREQLVDLEDERVIPSKPTNTKTAPVPLASSERTSLTSTASGVWQLNNNAVADKSNWEVFDEEEDDKRVAAAKQPDSPPQLPPRRKPHSPMDHTCQNSSEPRIYPIIVDGRQVSHTHYWIIPAPKQRLDDMSAAGGRVLHRRHSGEYQNVSGYSTDSSGNNHHTSGDSARLSTVNSRRSVSPSLLRTPLPSSAPSHQQFQQQHHLSPPNQLPPPLPQHENRSHTHSGASSKKTTPSGVTPKTSNSLEIEARHLQSMVDNSTLAEAQQALLASQRHLPTAITLLQVEQLYKLHLDGVTKEMCREYLLTHNWDVQRAAAALVEDRFSTNTYTNTADKPHQHEPKK